jgi:exonuclease III
MCPTRLENSDEHTPPSKYPDENDFTWSNKDMPRQSRIDFWLIYNSLDNTVVKVSIEPSICTDHKVTFLSLNINGSEVKAN